MRIDSGNIVIVTVLLAALALSVSCSDDDPAAPAGVPEFELATYTTTGSSSGPTKPLQEITVEFSVGEIQMFETPEPRFFGNRSLEDKETATIRPGITTDFDLLAGRLTNGVDGTAYVGVLHSRGSASTSDVESNMFTYNPALTFTGPDFIGYEVTAVRVHVDVDVTKSGTLWTLEYAATVTILGH